MKSVKGHNHRQNVEINGTNNGVVVGHSYNTTIVNNVESLQQVAEAIISSHRDHMAIMERELIRLHALINSLLSMISPTPPCK